MRLRSLMRLQEPGGAPTPSRGARSPGTPGRVRDSAAVVALISRVRPCGLRRTLPAPRDFGLRR